MPRLLPALAAVALLALGACRDDPPADEARTTTSTPATSTSVSTTTAPTDPGELDALLLEAADLPAGFGPAEDVDDTITTFCAGEDATAGLQASARSVRGFVREGGGASVIHLVFRFRDDGAQAFVAQAAESLGRCSGVPDIQGLAFDYAPLAPEVEAAVTGADEHAGRYGTSVGSAKLSIDVVVMRRGDIGQLVAVLGLDQPRADLDALAVRAFAGAVGRLPAG